MLGGLIGGALSFLGGERRNSAQAKAADNTNAFSERLSSTAYQRGMADMRKAGLNPILAYKQGGASSPAGTMPQFQDTLSPAVGAYFQGNSAQADVRLKDSQSKVNHAQVQKISEEILSIPVVRNLTEAQQRQAVQMTSNLVQAFKTEVQKTDLTAEQFRGQFQTNNIRQVLSDLLLSSDAAGIARSLGGTSSSVVKSILDAASRLPFHSWFFGD